MPAVGYAGGDPAGADGGGARAVCGGALRDVSALPWPGAGCRWAEVLPALRLRGLDKEESAGVLGEVLLLSLCGDLDDRSFRHDVAWKSPLLALLVCPWGVPSFDSV